MVVKIINIILTNTFTTDELSERVGCLREYYAARIFKNDTTSSVADLCAPHVSEYTVAVLEEWDRAFKREKLSDREVYDALDHIEEEVSKLPSVVVYVPIRFTHEYVARFGRWFRANVQPNIFLKLHTDPRVAGGCAFVWNDRYHDFSLRFFIHKNRKAIVDMFNRHAIDHA